MLFLFCILFFSKCLQYDLSLQVMGSDNEYHLVHNGLRSGRSKRSVPHTRLLKSYSQVSSKYEGGKTRDQTISNSDVRLKKIRDRLLFPSQKNISHLWRFIVVWCKVLMSVYHVYQWLCSASHGPHTSITSTKQHRDCIIFESWPSWDQSLIDRVKNQ